MGQEDAEIFFQLLFMCQITKQIESWINDRANNALEPGSELPAFAKPLVGFASGEDELFSFLKADIGHEFYWTPEEAFLSAFPEEKIRADSTQYGFASSWSERHTAHVCGLGTFGVSDGLITPVGKAVRVGSVIVRKRFKSTPRSYKNHNE
jgi:hypothetical protein